MSATERQRTSARRESLLGDRPGAFASARYVRVTPLKARRVVDLVRGLPVDHPHGGGEGKTSGGRHPVSPWGQPEGRTRKANKPSDRLIVRRRSKKKR